MATTYTNEIKSDQTAATDLTITTGAAKTLVFATPPYDDLQFSIAGGKVPAANYPNWESFTTNTFEYAFDVDEYIDLFANEPPHGWQEQTTLSWHIHIANKSEQATGADRFAKFQLIVSYADVNAVWAEETPFTGEWTIPTGTSALTHKLLVLGSQTNTLHIGSQLKVRIKRVTATGGTEYADSVFITQVGAHLLIDTIGSRSISDK
jgi:hypothetical protein